jgi:hypothetical protein
MVNGWLRSGNLAVEIGRWRRSERIFATKAALTSPRQGGAGRSEVVLDQAILGLLIKWAVAHALGNFGELRNKADLGRDSPQGSIAFRPQLVEASM